jgi:hypothetical protein
MCVSAWVLAPRAGDDTPFSRLAFPSLSQARVLADDAVMAAGEGAVP